MRSVLFWFQPLRKEKNIINEVLQFSLCIRKSVFYYNMTTPKFQRIRAALNKKRTQTLLGLQQQLYLLETGPGIARPQDICHQQPLPAVLVEREELKSLEIESGATQFKGSFGRMREYQNLMAVMLFAKQQSLWLYTSNDLILFECQLSE